MTRDPKRAKESWLNDGNPDHEGDAALLCVMAASGSCVDGTCRLDGWCFRGFGSAEVRYSIERRLDAIDRTLHEFLVLAFDQRRQLAINKIREDVQVIRDNVLPFNRRKDGAA